MTDRNTINPYYNRVKAMKAGEEFLIDNDDAKQRALYRAFDLVQLDTGIKAMYRTKKTGRHRIVKRVI